MGGGGLFFERLGCVGMGDVTLSYLLSGAESAGSCGLVRGKVLWLGVWDWVLYFDIWTCMSGTVCGTGRGVWFCRFVLRG